MDATESADLYAATRARVTETAQALTAEQLNTRVPACPDWTVHNLISHLAGVAGDSWRATWTMHPGRPGPRYR
jgi:hypothetical protein